MPCPKTTATAANAAAAAAATAIVITSSACRYQVLNKLDSAPQLSMSKDHLEVE